MDRSSNISMQTQLSSSQDPLPNQQQPPQQITRDTSLAAPPPPLPPRTASNGVRTSYRPNMAYNAMSYNMPYSRPYGSSYSPFGAFGSFGGGFGTGYGYPNAYQSFNNPDNAFIRLAEESSRPAFQSIESLVNAVGSISMMLESTYHAVYSSYRAVLGVVENFSRLKSQLSNILSTLALVRALQWLVYRLLYFLRLTKNHPSAEAAWAAATDTALKSAKAEDDPGHSVWPIAVFLGLVFGAPWLLFRIFSKMAAKKLDVTEEYIAVGLYDFKSSNPSELSFRRGQRLLVAPESVQPKVKNWILATADKQQYGLIPANYVRIFLKKKKSKSPMVVPTPNAECIKNFSDAFNEVTTSNVEETSPEEQTSLVQEN